MEQTSIDALLEALSAEVALLQQQPPALLDPARTPLPEELAAGQRARLEAAQAALRVGAALLGLSDPAAALDPALDALAAGLRAWRKSGRYWLEDRVIRRRRRPSATARAAGDEPDELLFGPYRYVRWRDATGRLRSHCLGRVDQLEQAAYDPGPLSSLPPVGGATATSHVRQLAEGHAQPAPAASSSLPEPRHGAGSVDAVAQAEAMTLEPSAASAPRIDAPSSSPLVLPPAPPRPLPSPRSKTIGLLISYIDVGSVFSSSLQRGIHAVAREQGLQLLTFQECDPHWVVQSRLGLERVDGWISVLHTDGADDLVQQGSPVITVAQSVAGICPAVMADNRGGVRSAVQHLVAHGHTRIGYMGWFGSEDLRQRYEGYQQGLADHGLQLDPALVFPLRGNAQRDGRRGAQQLMEAGMPCSAIVVATDWNAIGMIEALQEAGYHIPEDLAVIGFDDVSAAQYMRPPLSTIQQPVVAMGEAAARLLYAMIGGARVEPEQLFVPTRLILRSSCGCGSVAQPADHAQEPREEPDWRGELERQLALLVPTQTYGDQLWPGAALISQGLSAALEGAPLPSLAELSVDLLGPTGLASPSNLETTHRLLELVEQTAARRLRRAGQDAPDYGRLFAFFQTLRQQLLLNQRSSEIARNLFVEELLQSNFYSYRVTFPLLERGTAEILSLDWLTQSKVSWGCIGIWPDYDGADRSQLLVAGHYSRDGAAREAAPAMRPGLTCAPQRFPPAELATPARERRDDVIRVFRIKTYTQTDDWGFLAVSAPAESFLEHVGMWAHMIASVFERERLVSFLTNAKQAAEEANRLKSRFITTISHELRTPLNALLGFADLLGSPAFAHPDGQRYLQQRIVTNGGHLLGLINDVLDLAKIEAGRLDIQLEELDLRPLIEGVLSMIDALIGERPIRLELDLPDHLPAVRADPVRVRQVLLNLLSNAAKFTSRGHILVRARCDDDRFLCLAVEDTGIGIAAEEQQLIFEEFRQAQGGLTREYQGTGLGLPICRRLIELHGGELWLESSYGEGSTFFFTLPLAHAEPAQPLAQREQAPLRAVGVLVVVDDNDAAQQSIRSYLERMGYRVISVLEPGQALEVVLQHQPQLVIVNTQLYDGDGWDVVAQLRGHPEASTIPVLVSPLADQQALHLALAADSYLLRPPQPERPQTGIRRTVSRRTGTKTVLVIDDYEDARQIMRIHLERMGYRVSEASNGVEGLALMREQRPDLVLLDLMMPRMDGFEVLRQLREDPSISQIPVIVLTAQVLSEAEMARLNSGVATVLEKGVFKAEEVLDHVGEVLSGAHPSTASSQLLVRAAIAFIHTRYAQPISRKAIAQYLGISQRHLSRVFRQQLAIAPMTYLMRYRVSQATALLAAGDMSVAEVAEAVGFASEFYFSRLFLREVGVSPGAYRRGTRR